ncbi:30S ribosomal protein S3 [Candidatus Woesearchaeota archaeon]|nr:30S ribosomal protein S3 [Candidatus Woesearchaeota archaeon]
MIERNIINQRMKEFQIEEYIFANLKNAGHSHTRVQRTPLGEKIIIYTSRPGMIVGRKGQNIKKLTITLKKMFDLENPQIEIAEVPNPNLDAQIIAERIALSLERFGSARFKGIAHKALQDVMGAGALGIEVHISGKVPSQRAKSWRFYQGYLKKCGDIALTGVYKAYATAKLKSGVVGVKVSIMPPTTVLPDDITVSDTPLPQEESVSSAEQKAKTTKKEAKPKTTKRASRPKKKADAEVAAQVPETVMGGEDVKAE